jgi:GDP-L-fucose synthase
MAERVLLTGATGFFGRRIAAALREHGYDLATPGRPDFDLMDPTSVLRTFERIRPVTIVHSAAYYGGLGICMAEPARIFHRNIVMGANLLEASVRAGVRKIMVIGSACAYPANIAGDMNEDNFWSGPLHPSVEAYGFTKKVLEVGLHAYARQHGIVGQMPVITNLYGESDVFGEYRSHVAAALIKKFADAVRSRSDRVVCWGTGAPIREFIYSGDAAEAVVCLLSVEYHEPLNIGTGIGTSIRELAEIIAKRTGFRGEIVWDEAKPDGAPRKVLDVSRMKSILAWEPPTSLEAGLARTISWYLANKAEADARN